MIGSENIEISEKGLQDFLQKFSQELDKSISWDYKNDYYKIGDLALREGQYNDYYTIFSKYPLKGALMMNLYKQRSNPFLQDYTFVVDLYLVEEQYPCYLVCSACLAKKSFSPDNDTATRIIGKFKEAISKASSKFWDERYETKKQILETEGQKLGL